MWEVFVKLATFDHFDLMLVTCKRINNITKSVRSVQPCRVCTGRLILLQECRLSSQSLPPHMTSMSYEHECEAQSIAKYWKNMILVKEPPNEPSYASMFMRPGHRGPCVESKLACSVRWLSKLDVFVLEMLLR